MCIVRQSNWRTLQAVTGCLVSLCGATLCPTVILYICVARLAEHIIGFFFASAEPHHFGFLAADTGIFDTRSLSVLCEVRIIHVAMCQHQWKMQIQQLLKASSRSHVNEYFVTSSILLKRQTVRFSLCLKNRLL